MKAIPTTRGLKIPFVLFVLSLGLFGCTYESGFGALTCDSDLQCPDGAVCSDGYCAMDSAANNTNNTNNQSAVFAIEISPEMATVIVGESQTFTATVLDENSNVLDVPVTWSNSRSDIASFDEATGELVGLSVGSTVLTAEADGVSASAMVTVETNIGSITVEPAQVNLGVGTSSSLTAEVLDVNGMTLDVEVVWSSQNDDIVTVDSEGLITGVAVGMADVTAEYMGVSASSSINVVEAEPASLVLDPQMARVRSDSDMFEIRAIVRDADMNVIRGQPVMWGYTPVLGGLSQRAGAPDVVVYDADPLALGTTTITATLGELTDSMTLEVYEPMAMSVMLGPSDPTIGVDERLPLMLTVVDEDGVNVSDPDVQWFTDDSDVAQVDETTGELVGIGPGTATITATVDGIDSTITVTVVFQADRISAGQKHTCALTPSGTIWCWGEAGDGQLGNGSTSDIGLPEAVDTMLTFQEVAAGDTHTCARDGGTVYCWGGSANGRLGIDPLPADTGVPNPVTSTQNFVQISAVDDHTCALDDMGDIYCWGEGTDGRLGDDSDTDRNVPTRIADPDGEANKTWKSVAAGVSHTCAIDMSDAVYCWGANGSGELGDDSTTGSFKPVPVSVASIGSPQFIEVSAGGSYSCAITSSNDAYCWGDNANGRLGIGTGGGTRDEPNAVAGGLKFQAISANFDHTCGLTMNGDAYCWGRGANGRLGVGSDGDEASPTIVVGGRSYVDISSGGDHGCAITMGSVPWCWGRDDRDQLGADDPGDTNTPVQVWP